jgi:hypothetical protein
MTAPTTTAPSMSPEMPPRPSGGPGPGSSSPRPIARMRALVAGIFSGTPGRLRLVGAVGIVASLVFGVVGFVAIVAEHSDISAARSNAAQLVRVQTIRTNLVKADASATNAFLVGGLEPRDVSTAYRDGIATAARTIAEAASANATDGAALEGVNRVLARYAGLVESARANNRQGFPIGAAYLRQASNLMQQSALPALATLVTVEQARVDGSVRSTDSPSVRLAGFLLLAMMALIGLQLFVYSRTRRVFNPSLLVATAVVLLAGLVALGVMAWSRSGANSARNGAYRQTVALATARINGFDAKSAEALTLINRGSGQPYEDRFKVASGIATRATLAGASDAGSVIAPTAAAFEQYLSSHTEVRKLDDGGKWDEAVKLATGSGSANRDFAAFEQVSRQALAGRASTLSDDFDSARLPLTALAWLVLLAGIAAGVATWRGVNQRLREYR